MAGRGQSKFVIKWKQLMSVKICKRSSAHISAHCEIWRILYQYTGALNNHHLQKHELQLLTKLYISILQAPEIDGIFPLEYT